MLAVLAGCSGRNNLSDAYGNFESIEYLISAEGQGKILEFELEENRSNVSNLEEARIEKLKKIK